MHFWPFARIPSLSTPADLSAGLVVTARTVAEALTGWGRRAGQVAGGQAAAELWDITEGELKEIRRSLEELG